MGSVLLAARIKENACIVRGIPWMRDRFRLYWFTVLYILIVEGNEITAERYLAFIELLLERWGIAPASEEIHPPTVI